MRRALAALVILALAPACNQIFGLDAPADDDIVADDDSGPIDADATDAVPLDAPPGCGDDALNPQIEECDDGNLVPWDGCNAACKLEVNVGCADGTREGIPGANVLIAACAGAWDNPGLPAPPAPALGCTDVGNDGPSPAGASCSASNLCAAGWSICADATQVTSRLAGADCGEGFAPGFYAANQPSDGLARCTGTGANDLFGCGDNGTPADPLSCTPLTQWSGNLCAALAGDWQCNSDDNERTVVVKLTAPGGGVLCCR
jgi:cysteine-rich repeat protein